MWTFGLIMLVGCASFLPNEAVRQLVASLVPGRFVANPAAETLPALAQETACSCGRQEVPEPALMVNGAGQ